MRPREISQANDARLRNTRAKIASIPAVPFFFACLVMLLAAAALAWLLIGSDDQSTRKNLERLGLVFKMHGNDLVDGRFPMISRNSRIWALNVGNIYPKYLRDVSVLVARGHPDAEAIQESLRAVLEGPNPDYQTASGLMALSFAYLGYAVVDEPHFQTVYRAKRAGLLPAPGGNNVILPDGEGTIVPLWDEPGCRFGGPLPSDLNRPQPGSQSARPILVEIWQWRLQRNSTAFSGAHVLFMDGHVAWVPLGTFPVVPSVMDGLTGVTP